MVWLDKPMCWFAAASGKRQRSPKFLDAAIQFCLTLENLFGLALRQITEQLQSVLQLSGLTYSVPSFSTLCRHQLKLNVQVPYTQPWRVASAGRFDRNQAPRRRRVECKKHGSERCPSGVSCTLVLIPDIADQGHLRDFQQCRRCCCVARLAAAITEG